MYGETVKFSGINLREDPQSLRSDELRRSINANTHDELGTIRLRSGRTSLQSVGAAPYRLFRNRISSTRYQVAGTSLYRAGTVVTDYRSLSLSGGLTGVVAHRPLNDSVQWTFAADRGAMQKDNALVTHIWGILQPDIPGTRDNGDIATTDFYRYRTGITYIRYDGVSVAHESNPSGTEILADKFGFPSDTAPDATAGPSRGMVLSPATSTGICVTGEVEFNVSYGSPPFTWQVTGETNTGLTITLSSDGRKAIIRYTNPGPNVAGTAYNQVGHSQSGVNCDLGINFTGENFYDCNNDLIAGLEGEFAGCAEKCMGCGTQICCDAGCNGMPGGPLRYGMLQANKSLGRRCDKRTASMISSGCAPCYLVFDRGVLATVRDSRGDTASGIIAV